jgi:hypothetical protein
MPGLPARADTKTGQRHEKLLAISLSVALALLGCAKAPSSSHAPPALAAMAPSPGGAATTPAAPSADRAMRITVETSLLVQHRDPAVSALRELVQSYGGYVGEGTVSGADVGGSAQFTAKVPATRVADFRAKLAALGEVTSDSEKAEDVTEARADTKARLRNARAEDQRLLDLLANRTGTLADVVLVEKELASVRETIERVEAEERTLEGQIAFATVKVRLDTIYVATSEGAAHRLAEAATEGLTTAKSFVLGTLALALSAGPTLLIMGAMGYALFLGVRAWRRRGPRAPGPRP